MRAIPQTLSARALSRRRLLSLSGVGAAGAGAVLLGGCGAEEPVLTAGDDDPDDVSLLNGALAIEHGMAAAYTIGSEPLSGGLRRTMRRIADQEREHAEALRASIVELGGEPVEPLGDERYTRRLRLDRRRSRGEMLDLMVRLENELVGGYVELASLVSEPELRRRAFAIIGNEGQHLSVLYGELGQVQAPDAFVAGTPGREGRGGGGRGGDGRGAGEDGGNGAGEGAGQRGGEQ